MPGDHQTPGSDQSHGDGDTATAVGDALLDQRITGLIDRGLERYGAGELDGAITEWEHALALDPENARASEYVDYVRENYDLLQERMEVVREMSDANELDVPFGLESVGDGDAYDMVEVFGGSGVVETAAQRAPTKRYEDAIDEGWFLDDEGDRDQARADRLPPPPESIDPAAVPVGVPPADLFDVDGLPDRDTVGTDGELIDSMLELGLSDDGDMDLDDPYDDVEFGDESEKTTEVSGGQLGFVRPASQSTEVPSEDEQTVPGGVEGETYSTSARGLSEDALRAITMRGMPRLERESSPDETTAERSGIAGRLRLDGLEELSLDLGHDDRALEDSGETPALGGSEFRDSGDEETIERGNRWARPDGSQPLDFGDPLGEMEQTRDRSVVGSLDQDERAPTEDPSFSSSPVIVDRNLLAPGAEDDSGYDAEATREHRAVRPNALSEFDREADTKDRRRSPLEEFAKHLEMPEPQPGGPFGDLAVEILIDVDGAAPRDESDSDRVRRRVTALIERAETEWQAGKHDVSVAAIDLALDEDPDSAVAQKLIQRHKDRFYEMYGAYLGSLERCPVLALPMHELAQQNIDNRAAFLLSRIDGSLSFDEVLDVSGMTRLEAFRLLARMVMQGILEVR